MSELSLAGLVPLWRTIRERSVTALVTPALDYVGGLELATRDVRFDSEEQIASFGESLRNLVGSLNDGCSLLFLYRVTSDAEAEIREYEEICARPGLPALAAFVDARAGWLREQRLRRTRLFVFFSHAGSLSGLARGALGLRLAFANAEETGAAAHEKRLEELSQLRDRLVSRFAQAGLPSRELAVEDIARIHHELLNPSLARQRLTPPGVTVRQNLFDESTLRAHPFIREYTEAEQLCHESIDDQRGHFRHGDFFRRCLTLKILPEGGTDYFSSEPLLSLAVQRGQEREPLAYTLAVAVQTLPQAKARFHLNARHQLVSALRNAVPFLKSGRNVEQETTDAAHEQSIEALFAELTSMSSKLVTLSATLLLEANTLRELDAHTEAVRAAYNSIGNSQLLVEDVAQVPAFLSMMPGAGAYQFRKKGCTSRNAGDFLPVFAAWRGCSRAASVLQTPAGDVFRWDSFDRSVAAHHGFVAADTGSGKSVTLGALTLDALASGVDAILVDNGGSWRPLTELMGGTFLPVSLTTSICPFPSFEGVVDPATGAVDPRELEQIVSFLNLCVTDAGKDGFDLVQTDIVARAVQRAYVMHLRHRPEERPVISIFRDELQNYGGPESDRQIAQGIARRLAIYCDGLYGEFLNRPSKLRFDARLLTFDMAGVSQNATAKKLAMATVMQAIGNRAQAKRRRTLVEVDEGHEYLGTDAVAERFLAGCYRKMRKFDVAMWMISQNLGDFADSKVGEAIIGNSHLKLFLKHGKGGNLDRVVRYFNLSMRAAAAFANLERRAGHYSDLFILYGGIATTARLALHPLAYWILTTDPVDRALIERTAAKNLAVPRLEILTALAKRYPHGAANGVAPRSRIAI
jgi:hypothetical protein